MRIATARLHQGRNPGGGAHADHRRSRFALAGFERLRILLGAVLLLAAILKAYQLATTPVAATGIFDSRLFLIALVQFELLAGLWLWSGIAPKSTWVATVVGMLLFAGVSLWKAISGADSCGCFGAVAVHPWFTFTLDLAILAALVICRPVSVRSSGTGSFFGRTTMAVVGLCPKNVPVPLGSPEEQREAAASSRIGPGWVIMAWLMMGAVSLAFMASYEAATLADTGEVVGDGEYVVVEPAKWIGKRFALADHIDVGVTFHRGLWLVLLYRHDCSACRSAASGFETLAAEFSATRGCPNVSIVECPPYAPTVGHDGPDRRALLYGRLTDARQWRIPTPVALLIDDGKVGAIFDDPRDLDLIRAIWGAS